MIINHTEWGMQTFKDDELTAKLRSLTDVTPDVPQPFGHLTTWRQIR
jgi:hypothetical protein